MKLIRSRHLEYLIMSTIAPITILLLVLLLITMKSITGEENIVVFSTVSTFLMLWMVLTWSALSVTPGYGKYVWYLFALPVGSGIIIYVLEVDRISGLVLFGTSMVITWLGSLIVCAADWYKVNHPEFQLVQDKFR